MLISYILEDRKQLNHKLMYLYVDNFLTQTQQTIQHNTYLLHAYLVTNIPAVIHHAPVIWT
jgi:hypothetical protein